MIISHLRREKIFIGKFPDAFFCCQKMMCFEMTKLCEKKILLQQHHHHG